MISQGVIEQSSLTPGYNRINTANSGRILETNTENLLRMVLDKALCLVVKVSVYHLPLFAKYDLN